MLNCQLQHVLLQRTHHFLKLWAAVQPTMGAQYDECTLSLLPLFCLACEPKYPLGWLPLLSVNRTKNYSEISSTTQNRLRIYKTSIKNPPSVC